MKKTVVLFAAIAVGIVLASHCHAQEKRLALIIGNADYKNEKSLKNPINDANDMEKALRSLGFDVIARLNAGKKDMVEIIREFGNLLKKNEIGLFYFAGHGVQHNGNNYLIPTDADIRKETDLEFESVNAGRVLAEMTDAGNRLNIVILDACRRNPFLRNFRSATRGLAKMDAPAGTLIAYATAPNDVAEDGKGRNGTYTSNLLKNMATTGLPVELVFKRVRDGVIKDSNNLQVPWEATSLSGKDFYFVADSEKPDILPKSIKSVEPEKPKESTLSITADVSGAEVWLDGKNYGQLPRKLTLTGAGKYKLEIIAPGYNKYQISKDVELGNEYEIVAHLEREPEPVKTSVDESESSSSQVKQKPKYILRSKEKEVSSEEAPSVFGLKYGTEGFLVPIEYIKNNFKDNGDGTITDHATGLMWQKSGSWEGISGYDYTRELQKKKFAGYDDWREPTVDELKSLLTQEKQSNGMHINPIFDQTQSRCSTSDRVASDYISGYWGVNFKNGFVNNYNNWRESLYIRAVRSLK